MSKQTSQQSFSFRQQMHIGAEIANQLPKLMGLTECGKKLGISDTMVRRIECQALFKVSQRVKSLAAKTALAHE